MKTFARLSIIAMLLGVLTLPLHAAIEEGLLLYFAFDSASGDVVDDLSGGGHDGTLKEGAAIVGDSKINLFVDVCSFIDQDLTDG